MKAWEYRGIPIADRIRMRISKSSHGSIPEGRHVLHTCDNPGCVNIEHLHLGTHADNMREKMERGRCGSRPTGAAHKRPMAKLTEAGARAIKSLLERGYRQSDIATDFKVSRQIVSDIALRKTWAWLDED